MKDGWKKMNLFTLNITEKRELKKQKKFKNLKNQNQLKYYYFTFKL